MTSPEADELPMLRQRAYGPSADIHHDPAAEQRLRQLEAENKHPAPPGPDQPIEQAAPPLVEDVPEPDEPIADPAPPAIERRRLRFRMRPLTAVLLTAAIVLLVAAWLAFTLVERVQISPLQPDATQVARLSSDDDYDVPPVFAGGPAGSGEDRAYQDFYGLRAVINGYSYSGNAEDDCIVVYPAERVNEADPNSFSGPTYFGCAAGAFPAAATFRVGRDLPQELQDAYPDGTALQFVLDERSNEVVVFVDE